MEKLTPNTKTKESVTDKVPESNQEKGVQENINKTPIQKEKKTFKAVIVDTTDVLKEKAENIGDTKMNIEPPKNPEDLKGFKKYFKQEFWNYTGKLVWRHGMARDYFRNKEINKASKEILETDNLFVGEGKDKVTNDKFVSDIINQFSAESEELIHKVAGEEKLTNEEIPEEKEAKDSIKNLIKKYASGNISKESFRSQEERIFNNLKSKVEDKKIKESTMHASNLEEIAEQIKTAIAHGEFCQNEDFEIDLIYGKSKAGLRTEEQFTKTEKIVDKLLHTKVGQFTNDTSIVLALSCAGAFFTKSLMTIPGKIVPVLGSATIGSAFAGARKGVEMEQKRKEHFKKMTLDEEREKFDGAKMPSRNKLEEFRYQMDSAEKMTGTLVQTREFLNQNEANLTPEMVQQAVADLAKIEGRILLSDRRRVDLVTYSNSESIVKERMGIDIERAQLKTKLEELYNSGKFAVPNGQNFEDYLKSLSTTAENALITDKEVGIDARDRSYNKMKSSEKWKAAWSSFKRGVITGAVFQELFYTADGLWGGDRVGVGEDIIRQIKGEAVEGVGPHQLSMLTYMGHALTGEFPKVDINHFCDVLIGDNHIKLPDGTDLVKNIDGSYNLISGGKTFAENLTTNPDGSFTDAANHILKGHGIIIDQHSVIDGVKNQTIDSQDFVKTHPNIFEEIKHRLHLDNGTPNESNLNELKTVYGGVNGTGIDANGNYVLNIGRMTSDGSFHNFIDHNNPGVAHIVGDDAQELMRSGKMVILFTLNNETGGHAISIPVSPEGNIMVPADSDYGRMLFSNDDGHANLMAKFAEVGTKTGDESYEIFSTVEGRGIDDVIQEVPSSHVETILTTPGIFDTNFVYIPSVLGDPNEKLIGVDKKAKKEKGDRKSTNKKDGEESEIDAIGAVPIGSEEREKKEITDDDIKDRAQKIYEERLKSANPEADWSEAERQLISERDEKIKEIEKEITDEEKSKRAYEIYEKRQKEGKEGNQDSDWFEAERQLKKEQEDKVKKIREITEEEKVNRAKKIYEKRMVNANPEGDWAEAERQLKEEQKNNPEEFKNKEVIEKNNNAYEIGKDGQAIYKNNETISDKEYKDYVDNNIVSALLIKKIAEKNKKGESLSPREQAIFSNNTNKIEKELSITKSKEDKIEKTKKEVIKQYEAKETPVKNKIDDKKETIAEKIYSIEDLSKIGTEFESKKYTYKTLSSSKPFWEIGRKKITFEVKDRETGKTVIETRTKKYLKKYLDDKSIKITKVLESK